MTTVENGASTGVTRGSWWSFIFALALMIVPSLFFVTGQSVWVDEGSSAWFASHARGVNPDQFLGLAAVPEMPLFHILLMGWVRVFGDSERALRSINIPFAALFLGSVLALCRSESVRLWWLPAVPFAVFPLLTYYVNECRPYAALLALSTAMGCALLIYRKAGGRWEPWVCCLCGLAAFAMHMLGGLAVVALVPFVLFDRDLQKRLREDWKNWAAAVLVSAAAFGVTGLYYLRVAQQNILVSHNLSVNPGTPSNMASTWKNVAFFFYEALGFSGLGPPRNALRVHASAESFHGYFWLMLLGLVALVAVCMCFLTAARGAGGPRLLGCCVLGVVALFFVARAFHFGFFGRHGMALVGLLCCALALALSSRSVGAPLRAAVVALLVIAWGVSSARLLFVYAYGKDDARSALREARAQGIPILWNAGDRDAGYYGGFDVDGKSLRVFAVAPSMTTVHWRKLTELHVLPNVPVEQAALIASRLRAGSYVMVKGKADVFDPGGSWSAAMAGWQPRLLNRLNGFDVWRVTVPPRQSR